MLLSLIQCFGGVFLVCALLCCSCKREETKVIEVNEIILPKTPDTYQEVRHIVLRGTNQEIGKAMGDIAQEWLGIKPRVFKNELVGKANRLYRERNYPLLAERMKGIAQSYHLAQDVDLGGALIYDLWPTACSAVYFPPNSTKNGHALVAHNFDWRTGSFAQLFGAPENPRARKICSRNFVMELYPSDGGYASIGIGGMDLLNGFFGGMNSRGLFVSVLVDQNSPKNMNIAHLDESCGLISVALTRLILDTCATVEEAKMALLLNKMIFIFEGVHFLISDSSGKSVICEIDPKFFQWHFTDNNNEPQIMTNHACYVHPDSTKFVSTQDPYDSFTRYTKLERFIKNHSGKFSAESIKEAMSLVYGHGMKDEKKIRNRTLWREVYDTTDKTLEVSFYLKDGPLDPKTGEYGLVFSNQYAFKLKP